MTDTPPTVLGSAEADVSKQIKASSPQELEAQAPDPEQAKSTVIEVKSYGFMQVVGSSNFAMGMAWKAATLAIVDPTNYMQEPSKVDDIKKLWAITVAVVAIFLVLITCLVKYSMVLHRRAKALKGESASTLSIRSRILGIDAIVGWGLTFAVAAQIDTAVEASIEKDPPMWRVVYLGALILLVCILVLLLKGCFHSKDNVSAEDGEEVTLGAKVADAVLSGSAYVVALATLGVSDALLKLDDVSTSEDLGYIGMYTGGTIVVATIMLTILAGFDSKDAKATKERAIAAKAPQVSSTFQRSVRKFLSQVFSMCAVLACYALLYVALADLLREDGQGSLYDPLPVKGGLIFFGASLAVSVFGGLLFKCLSEKAVTRIEAVDRDAISGNLDDVFLYSLEALLRATAKTVLDSTSWLVGCALHALAVSLWAEVEPEESSDVVNVLVMCGFALLLTVIAVLAAVCLTRKPRQV